MASYSKRDSASCPDPELISAFLDGELDPSRAERVQEGLREYPAWDQEHDRQEAIKSLLRQSSNPESGPAMARVWARVEASTRVGRREVSLWRRRIAIPLPVVLGTACLLLLLAFSLVYTAARGTVGRMQITTAPSGIKQVRVEAPIQDLEELLRSLESGAAGREVIIKLPDDSEFFMVGEPVLLREADRNRSRFR